MKIPLLAHTLLNRQGVEQLFVNKLPLFLLRSCQHLLHIVIIVVIIVVIRNIAVVVFSIFKHLQDCSRHHVDNIVSFHNSQGSKEFSDGDPPGPEMPKHIHHSIKIVDDILRYSEAIREVDVVTVARDGSSVESKTNLFLYLVSKLIYLLL